jgi:hydroxypyruvate isomerase
MKEMIFGRPPMQNRFSALARAFFSGGEALKATSYAAETAKISPTPIRM